MVILIKWSNKNITKTNYFYFSNLALIYIKQGKFAEARDCCYGKQKFKIQKFKSPEHDIFLLDFQLNPGLKHLKILNFISSGQAL